MSTQNEFNTKAIELTQDELEEVVGGDANQILDNVLLIKQHENDIAVQSANNAGRRASSSPVP